MENNPSTVGCNLEGLGGKHTPKTYSSSPPPGCQVPVPLPTLLHFTSATLFHDLGDGHISRHLIFKKCDFVKSVETESLYFCDFVNNQSLNSLAIWLKNENKPDYVKCFVFDLYFSYVRNHDHV